MMYADLATRSTRRLMQQHAAALNLVHNLSRSTRKVYKKSLSVAQAFDFREICFANQAARKKIALFTFRSLSSDAFIRMTFPSLPKLLFSLASSHRLTTLMIPLPAMCATGVAPFWVNLLMMYSWRVLSFDPSSSPPELLLLLFCVLVIS